MRFLGCDMLPITTTYGGEGSASRANFMVIRCAVCGARVHRDVRVCSRCGRRGRLIVASAHGGGNFLVDLMGFLAGWGVLILVVWFGCLCSATAASVF